MMESDHSNTTPSITPDQKITQDLSTLTEKIHLCQSLLTSCPTPSSIDANESLLSVIGFLEACVPRMLELIESAAGGAVSESVFEECLVVNDLLANVLGDVGKDAKDRMPLSAAASASGAKEEEEIDLSHGLNELAVDSSSGVDPFASGDLLAPTTPVEDPFSVLSGEESKPAAVVGGAKVEEDEDFDAFFKDRTSASGSKED
jgi:hypothetical protein